MKRERDNDTDPMRSPAETTQPCGPPLGVQERPLESVTPVPTEQEIRETEELLEPIRRLAPQPALTQRANSDGGDFVSYSTTASPLARAVEARQLALVELDNLVSAPDPPTPPAVQSPTFVLPERRSGRALSIAVLLGATAVVVVIVMLVAVRMMPGSGAPATPASPASAPASIAVPLVASTQPAATVADVIASTAATASSATPPASVSVPKATTQPRAGGLPVPRSGANRAPRARQNAQDPLFSGDSPYGSTP